MTQARMRHLSCREACLRALEQACGPLTVPEIVRRTGYSVSYVRPTMCHLRTQWLAHVVSEATPHRWAPGRPPGRPPASTQAELAMALAACLRVMHASDVGTLNAEDTSILNADWDRALWDGMKALRRSGIEPPEELAGWRPARLDASLAMAAAAAP
jgi:hypothetical protein